MYFNRGICVHIYASLVGKGLIGVFVYMYSNEVSFNYCRY